MSLKQEQPTSPEQQLKVLIKSRKQIVDKISLLSKRRHFLGLEPKAKSFQGDEAQLNGNPRKMVKIQSSTSLKEQQKDPKREERVRSFTSIPKQEQNQSDSIKKIKEQQLKRNKRMFGGLNLHLDRAKNKIDQQKTKRDETNKILQKLQQKQRQKSQKIIKEQLDKINAQLSIQQKLKFENSKQVLKIQNLILLNSYIQYSNTIKPFAFTRAQPPISWKPTKEYISIAAKKLLGEREQEIQKKNKKIIQSIENYQNQFDFSLYLLENECEYYQNFIKNFYYQLKPFLKTNHQPSIFWKPNKQFQKYSTLKIETNKKIQELIQNYQKKCGSYYEQKISHLKQRRQKGHYDEHHGESNSQSPHKQEQD